MNRERVDAFVNDFLASLKPALDTTSPREMLRFVRGVCDEFQERTRDSVSILIIPMAFWMNTATDFAEAYMGAEDDTDLLLRLRSALRSRMDEFARNHSVSLEDIT